MHAPSVQLSARRFMRGWNVNLHDKYDSYRVTEGKVNAAKESATTPKWKAVIETFHTETAFASGTDTDPDVESRMLHLFFGVRTSTVADESNTSGGDKATNISKVMRSSKTSMSTLELILIDSKGSLPSFAEKIRYTSVKALRALCTMATENVHSSGTFDDVTTCTFQSLSRRLICSNSRYVLIAVPNRKPR